MPRKDGKGPAGKGRMTGGGLGSCRQKKEKPDSDLSPEAGRSKGGDRKGCLRQEKGRNKGKS